MASRDTSIADALKRACMHYWVKMRYGVYYELGLVRRGKLRADLLALNHAGLIVVCEVKSSVADFRTDGKMHLYLPYCNRMYLVTRRAVFTKVKNDIDPAIGVMLLEENDGSKNHGYMSVHRKAKWRSLDDEFKQNLILRCAWRGATHSKFNTKKRSRIFIPG